MRFTLKNPPSKADRPEPLKITWWIAGLCALSVVVIIFMHLSRGEIFTNHLWIIALAVAMAIWSAVFIARTMFYLWLQIKANAWDKRREQWILTETRKSRRALQILALNIITAVPDDAAELSDEQSSQGSLPEILMSNKILAEMQPTWQEDISAHISRIRAITEIDTEQTLSLDAFIDEQLRKLIIPVKDTLQHLPQEKTVAILFESYTSESARSLRNIWQKVWDESEITQQIHFVEGSGLSYADYWLTHRIRDEALLLVIALQIAPEQPEGTGEAVVALLLGNRLTQKTLEPLALLHRPDCAPADELDKGLAQAAYNVPLNTTPLNHLWLSGLTDEQNTTVTELQTKPPIDTVPVENIYNLDGSLGQTGCAAPWLAVAVAALAAQQTAMPQMIISGDAAHDALWSAVVSPYASRQEKVT